MLLPKASAAWSVVVVINTSRSGPARGVTINHTSRHDSCTPCYDSIAGSLSSGIEAICETRLVCCLFRGSIKFGRDGLIAQLLLPRYRRIFCVVSCQRLSCAWLTLVHYKCTN